MKETKALEERNMAVIERVYQRLREDKKSTGAHPCVPVVGGK